MANAMSRRNFVRLSGVAAAGMGAAPLLAGCGNSSTAGSDSTIKIGILGPFSGDVAQYGTACRNGAELYFDQNPKIGDLTVELNEQDEKGDATEAVNAYNKMVEDGVVGIIGDVTSTPAIAVAQASANDNLPCVTPSATAADVIKYGGNTFRVCVTDPFQGKVMADFASQQGWKTVGTIFNSGDDYSTGVNQAFCDEAAAKGITIVTQQGYSAGDVDFNGQLTTIISSHVDAIFCPNYYSDDGKIITQARQQGYAGPIFGVDGWDGIASGNYASAEDLQGCYYCCSFVSANEDSKAQQFVSAYKAKFDADPNNFCAQGYDAAMVLATGVQSAIDGGAKPSDKDFSDAVIKSIASNTVEGVTRTISYSGTGDPSMSTLIISFAADGSVSVHSTISADE